MLPGALHPMVRATSLSLSRRRAARRLGGQGRLHLACGTNVLPGWANVDLDGPQGVIKLDLTQDLPIADGRIEFVFCEHFIEHVPLATAQKLLREVWRCLRPGGVLRLSTPDLDMLVEHYQTRRLDTWRDVGWLPDTACRLLNEGMHAWGHEFVYDQTELERAFREAGFRSYERVRWRSSGHVELAGLECRPDHGELIYEASK
jgi:predicted SAM-dependent methyltransferase